MGDIMYSTVYFSFAGDPVMFTCFFNKTPHKYVGIQVENFPLDDITVKSYYFVGALDNEIRAMETKPGVLRDYLSSRPVIWCNMFGDNLTWKNFKRVESFYLPTEKATLS